MGSDWSRVSSMEDEPWSNTILVYVLLQCFHQRHVVSHVIYIFALKTVCYLCEGVKFKQGMYFLSLTADVVTTAFSSILTVQNISNIKGIFYQTEKPENTPLVPLRANQRKTKFLQDD